jgi:two-component system sensor histidine kinase KdpD
LLDAGIDVYTTLNIQHVESLNDVVASITRIRVRETVPDSSSTGRRHRGGGPQPRRPDPAPEGRQGLRPDKRRARAEALLLPGNLTALRELALRRTADRVDDELLSHMRANAIAGPWAAGERVLVCVSEDPRSSGLVRYTKRLADRLHAPWTRSPSRAPAPRP